MNRKSVALISVIFIAFILILALSNCGPGTSSASEEGPSWPRWRGPNGDGISQEIGWNPQALADGPKILWKLNIGVGYSNVAIQNTRLYTMGKVDETCFVYCLNAATGEKIWKYSYEGLADPESTPAIDGSYVYALGREGLLLCLEARTGRVRWEKDVIKELSAEELQYGYATSPVVAGDLLLLNLNSYGMAVKKETGDLLWASSRNDFSDEGYYSTPVLYKHDAKELVFMMGEKGLSSVEAATGNRIWHFPWSNVSIGSHSPNSADPIVSENKVFISGNPGIHDCTLLDISGNEPKELWKNQSLFTGFTTAVWVDGYLYGRDEDYNQLRCLDWKTGEVLWGKSCKMISLTVSDRKLIILEEDGTLHIAEATPSAYKEFSVCKIPVEKKLNTWFTPPVLCGAKIYCRNFFGDLVCIDVSK